MNESLTIAERKKVYAEFCEARGTVPLFLRPWWLDADAGPDNWDVTICRRKDRVVGAMPFCRTKLKWFSGIGMPPVAPYQGYVLSPSKAGKSASRLAREQKIVRELYDQLPPHTFFFQKLLPQSGNWLPQYWLGYRQTTRYTYTIEDLTDPDAVFNEFEGRARNAIRKAEEVVEVTTESDPKVIVDITRHTFGKQGMETPYDPGDLIRLIQACLSRDCGRLYVAKDREQQLHAAAFVVWDGPVAYDLIQGSHPERIHSGAISQVVWTALREAAAHGVRRFDFTGSMMEGVEKFLRSFGAVPVPYHYISKENTLIFYWLMRLKEYLSQAR